MGPIRQCQGDPRIENNVLFSNLASELRFLSRLFITDIAILVVGARCPMSRDQWQAGSSASKCSIVICLLIVGWNECGSRSEMGMVNLTKGVITLERADPPFTG